MEPSVSSGLGPGNSGLRGSFPDSSKLTPTFSTPDISTQPSLWAESESLLEPWANLTLTCEAFQPTQDFQLLKNGVVQEFAHIGRPAIKYHFPLGAVTTEKQGLYGCQTGLGSDGRWTELSNLLEVTGTESLLRPWLSTKLVPWVTPGLDTKLLCQVGLRGVTFLLRREDDDFLVVAEAVKDGQATFRVRKPGNYSCSYWIHAAGKPSEPSTMVTIKEYHTPPAPVLTFGVNEILSPINHRAVVCVAPVNLPEFQLRVGEENLVVTRSTSSPDRVFFDLNLEDMGNRNPVTCRYRLHSEEAVWSPDSEPLQLMWSDETLPAPVLTAEPEGRNPARGSLVQLRCTAPRAGLRFALQRENRGQRSLLQVLEPAGTEAVFQLRDISAADTGNYSCVYMDLAPPFSGSTPSASLELRVDGLAPRPKLRALWTGTVPAGRDAILHCEAPVPKVTFHLLRDGEEAPTKAQAPTSRQSSSIDLVLPFVGPQHTGNYSCRYTSWVHGVFLSELSEPVELLVGGS